LQRLLQAFQNDNDFQTIVSGIRAGMREQLVSGLTGSARQVMFAALYNELNRPLIIVTHNLYAAQKIAEDLQEMCDRDSVLLYPASELTLIDIAASSPETVAQRIDVLSKVIAVSLSCPMRVCASCCLPRRRMRKRCSPSRRGRNCLSPIWPKSW